MENQSTGRNKYDMIMELVALHVKQSETYNKVIKPEEIEELFEKYTELVKKI